MKLLINALAALVLCGSISAQQHSMPNPPAPKKATLMSGLGDLHHPVSTSNPEAQKFFDQGMRLIYAFNHQEAAGSFVQWLLVGIVIGLIYRPLSDAS